MDVPAVANGDARRVRSPATLLVSFTLIALAGVGCGSERSAGERDGATTTTTMAAVPTSTAATAEDSDEQQALATYRRFWDVYSAIAGTYPINPADPRLAEVATGQELTKVREAFIARRANNVIVRGTMELAPQVVSITADEATISDCYDSHLITHDAATGQPKETDDPQRKRVTATLQRDQGQWKVAAIRFVESGCVP